MSAEHPLQRKNCANLAQFPMGRNARSAAHPLQPQIEPRLHMTDKKVIELRPSDPAVAAEIRAEVDAFAAKHKYYQEVKRYMAALLAYGLASSLGEAYEQAIWACPSTRALRLEELGGAGIWNWSDLPGPDGAA